MDLSDIALATDLADLVDKLDRPPPGPKFALAMSRFIKLKATEKIERRGIKKLIRPENAKAVLPFLPSPGERAHCALCGDFVLGDIIPAIIEARGRCDRLTVATLGMSLANAEAIARLKALDLVGDITIVCSHYFAKVDQGREYRAVEARLNGIASIITTRCHAKIICLPIGSDSYVIEGSANLRSSDNTEQIVIFNDAQLLTWHCDWLSTFEVHG